MNSTNKKTYFNKATEHVLLVRNHLVEAVEKIKTRIATKMSSPKVEDRWVNASLKAMDRDRLKQLELLYGSPYFTKCEVLFDDTKETKTFYFGKFTFTEEKVYSWIAPVASIRFENPGVCSYVLPNGKVRTGTLLSKEQYMIENGQIVFQTAEALEMPRELIHQEHFSQTKASFALPEIVSQMEKAQDKVIRAHYKGAFVISGPAGSGKTTLALHRIAYLIQSPDTTQLYEPHSILVLVQDESTKAYFGELLPSLGITAVTITTFSEWAASIIGIDDISCISQFSEDDYFEFEKIKALRNVNLPRYNKNVFGLLQKIYSPFLNEDNMELFSEQKQKKILDRIDLTILLQAYRNTFKKLSTKRTYFTVDDNGELVEKSRTTTLEYSLIAVDEFQNYLPEQLVLFKNCVEKDKESLIYIGDMAQQVRCGTIRSWDQMQQAISTDRHVILNKVYRNTKNILEYILRLGYRIEIPEGIKQGTPVKEIVCKYIEEKISCIEKLIAKLQPGETLAVLTKLESDADALRARIEPSQALHILSMRQSQGLEFDKVCIVHFGENKSESSNTEFVQEKEKIEKDLHYVALTRAISELYIIIH